jgi:restriction endonuclease S subunit
MCNEVFQTGRDDEVTILKARIAELEAEVLRLQGELEMREDDLLNEVKRARDRACDY